MPSFEIRQIDSRWQPVHDGKIVRTSIINADGEGYATQEGAKEALERYVSLHWTETRKQQGDAWDQYDQAAEYVARTFSDRRAWDRIAFEENGVRAMFPVAQRLVNEDPDAFVELVQKKAALMSTYSIGQTEDGRYWIVLIDGQRAGNKGYKSREDAVKAMAELQEREGALDVLGQYQAAADFVAKNFETHMWNGIMSESDNSIRWQLASMFPAAKTMIDEDPEAFVDYVRRTANANAMKRPHLRDPEKRPAGYGLSDDIDHLNRLVRNEAQDNLVESGDATRESAREARATPELIEQAKEFDNEVWKAILEIVEKIPPKEGVTPFELWEAETSASTYIFMTLQGHGTGIWDTMWEDSFDKKDKRAIDTFLQKRLGKYADIAGGGSLEWAIREAAYETTEGGEPGDEVAPL
jgi:hypothetical protein